MQYSLLSSVGRSLIPVQYYCMCLHTYVISERDHARSTYKKNVLELVVGVLRETTSWCMLIVRTKEHSLLVVFSLII